MFSIIKASGEIIKRMFVITFFIFAILSFKVHASQTDSSGAEAKAKIPLDPLVQKLSASISGTTIISGGYYTWHALINNGEGPYSYSWKYRFSCSELDKLTKNSSVKQNIASLNLSCNTWHLVGNSASFRYNPKASGSIQLTVTDYKGVTVQAEQEITKGLRL
jgi:hypothetical protein